MKKRLCKLVGISSPRIRNRAAATMVALALFASLAAGCRSIEPESPDSSNAPPLVVTSTTAPLDGITASTTTTTLPDASDSGGTTIPSDALNGSSTTADTMASKAEVTARTTSTTKKVTTTSTTKKATTTTAQTKTDYLDTSQLTGTQSDIGKVVGFSSVFNADITVVSVTESYNGSGCKCVRTFYSDGTSTCVVECKYCHEMPCPNGGNESCSKYNESQDGSKYCQTCGLPLGDGYNGTCYVTIDWDNGGDTICHHYD